MKILIVNRYMSIYGGAETVIRELGTNLKKLGIENRIVTLNISEEVRKKCGSLDIATPKEEFSYKFRSTNFISSLGIVREIKALRRLVRKYASEFDLINVHNFPAEWVCAGLKKPVVWMCNEIPDFYNNPRPSLAIRLLRSCGIALDKFMVHKFIDAVCVADEFNAQKVFQRYALSSRIVNYGIEYELFSGDNKSEEVIKRYGLEGSFLLLQVGMLSPEKDQLKSVKALDALKDEIPNIKLVLAGRPQSPYEGLIKDYIVKRGLEKLVIFTGHIAKDEVRSLYQASRIALFPVKTQGGWLSPFEALCAGKPIVTSSTMGAASIIKREDIGVVSDDFVTAIRDIYNKYDFYLAMADRGRLWVKNNLTWESFTRKMLKIFQEVLCNRRCA